MIPRGIEGELGEAIEVIDFVQAYPSLARYRRRVERFIKEHRTRIAVARLIRDKPITQSDRITLQTLLFSEFRVGGSQQDYEQFNWDKPLGLIVRPVCGLDRNTAKEALGESIQDVTLSADQAQFVDEVVNRVVAKGYLAARSWRTTPTST